METELTGTGRCKSIIKKGISEIQGMMNQQFIQQMYGYSLCSVSDKLTEEQCKRNLRLTEWRGMRTS
jgi:hypothetical protein